MKHLYLLLLLLLLLPLAGRAQLVETFADGDFTNNPTWTGDAASFQVNSQVLQSNGPAVTGTQLQLVTACQASTGTTWEFWANLKLATSSGNLADVWLLASQADLKSGATKGYFVRLGGTDDEVSLFRKDSLRAAAILIDGQNGTLASTTNNVVRVRVTRSTAGVWKLERDLTGGRTFVAETGQPTDNTHTRSAFFGVSLLYSSANGRNFYFDDFAVTDATPPLLLRAGALDARNVAVVFNEAVEAATASQPARYRLASGAVPTVAFVSPLNPAVVLLTFGQDFAATNSLTVNGVADLYGNVAPAAQTVPFTGVPVAPAVGDLLITEIMADETPQVGLPASEFIEIYNRSSTKTLSLRGVRLLKAGSSTAAAFADTARLLPNQYAVVCGSTRASQFAPYGKVYGLTNFPSLTNAGDDLVLRGPGGTTLFEVAYTDGWYRDTRKKDGGWTLEMLDANNYCGGADNWQASQDPRGGTPAARNSVAAANPDTTPPTLLRATATGPITVRLYFGEKLDSATAANPALYRVQGSTGNAYALLRVAPAGPDFRAVDLVLTTALQASQAVTVTVSRATDCAGNASGALTSASLALPEAAQPGDLVINEVLYYHRPNGVYFVEVLNRSLRYVNLQGYQLTAQRSTGSASVTVSAGTPYVLAPGQLVALTSDASVLQSQYPSSTDPASVLALGSGFPALDNSSGTITLLDPLGATIDSYVYSNGQQLPLLSSTAGVSLERIRAVGPSTAGNFHSAASTVGYATPGRPNSQTQDAAGGQDWTVTPELFTPDDDGQQDLTTLNYQLDQPGYVASVTVYDALGQLTRRLLRNESLPTTGFVQWDGTDERGRKANVGYYLFYIELFRPGGGERREYKRTVVVGARL